MANTTFSGPVRSEGGFQVVSKNTSTGALTTVASTASTGIVTNKFVKHVGFATGVTVNTTAGDSPAIGEFTQPANTIITDIKIFCDTAPVIGTGDIGYEVGTSSSGAQIVAAVTDEILDGGTTVVIGNVTTTTLVAQTQSATTAPASVQYTSAERTIFCNITNTVDATTAGSFTFIIEYVQIA
tara:strand:+ start:4923 stop:5471 length:549 start_codon:yes stop_codon:yes gene_type:complete